MSSTGYLLVMLLAYNVNALEQLCCAHGEHMLVVQEQNDTQLVCNTTRNNHISIKCQNDSFILTLPLTGINTTVKKDDLVINFNGHEMMVTNGSYCFGTMYDQYNNIGVSYVTFCGAEDEPQAYAEVLSICMLISVFFYLLTAVIYIFLPQLRDLLGMCFINFCIAIGIGLFVLSIMQLVPYTEWDLKQGYCAARGFFAYFFLIAGFFWSNVISIQTYRSLSKPPSPNTECRTFLCYAVYAWGVPVLLTIIMAIVNYHPGTHARPGIGLNTCWFINSTQRWYYLYSIMTILILVNMAIFIYVSIVLWRSANFKSDHASDIRYKFSLTWKLCILMGLPWMFEMIGSLSNGAETLWFILDLVNMLQGVLIFIVLVALRKRVLIAMNERGWFLCLSDAVSNYLRAADDDEAQVVAYNDIQDMTVVDK